MIRNLFRQWGVAPALAITVVAGSLSLGTPHAFGDDGGYPKKNPLAGQDDAITEGARLYIKLCATCHGMKATGFTRFAPYATDLRKFWRGYPEFVRITLNGRTKKRMPPWGGVLDEDEISQIGAYLETLAVDGANWVAY